jgi:hypothetical protein
VETDPSLLVTLLAVRLLGQKGVPVTTPLLKSLKVTVKQAAEQGLLKEGKAKVAVTKDGKTSSKQVAVVDLTDQGEELLRRAATPEALAATNAGYVAALRQSLEADRQQLRAEVGAAVKARSKGPDEKKIQKELEGLGKKLAELGKQLQKLEAATQAADESPILTRIDQAFAALQARVEQLGQGHTAPGRTDQGVTAPADSLRTVLHNAYEKLCRFIEFQDGVVELPRLYHEARRTLPGLTVPAFQAELMALWQQRELELHVLNEVAKATEPEKGVRQHDKLYYYVQWRRP